MFFLKYGEPAGSQNGKVENTIMITDVIEQNEMQTIADETTKIIAKATAKASAISALPLPLVDVAGVIYVQMKMVEELAELRGLDVSDKGKLFVSSIITGVVGKMLSEAAMSLAEATSVDQLLTGTLVRASISGFITTITGEVYDHHFRGGGTLDDISYRTYIEYFNQQLKSDRLSIDNLSANLIDSTMERFGVA